MRFINIRLNVHQYRDLMDLVFPGHYIAQGHSEGADKRYDDVCQRILSFNQQADMDDMVAYDEREKRYLFTDNMYENLSAVIEEYDEEVFWDELTERFASRELAEMVDEEEWQQMDARHRYEILSPLLEKYSKEFEDNGLDNLTIIKKNEEAWNESSIS